MNVYERLDPVKLLEGNTYPGRGIMIGQSPDGKNAVIAYFIMGRSVNSRNRVFEETDGGIITKAHDESKLEDPSLIIYAPVRTEENNIVVTNGDQTDTIVKFLKDGMSFEDALRTREFEPDEPNFTPRISGILTFDDGSFTYKMSILKSSDEKGSACSRYFYEYPSIAGVGHFIHTYNCDGDPIPTFTGEPERIAMCDDIDEFADSLWSALNADNKISLYVRYVSLDGSLDKTRIINKNK